MGLKLFGDGRYLIQVQKYGIKKTKRGTGGEREGQKEMARLVAEIEDEFRRAEAARMLGVELPKGATELPKPLTFAQLFHDKYQPWAKAELHPSTWDARQSTHWHLLAFFGDKPLDQIDSNLVDEFKRKRLTEGVIYRDSDGAQNRKPRPLSKAGLAEQLKVLRAILGWAIRKGYLKTAPHVEMPKDKRGDPGAAKPVRYFTEEERARLLRRCNPRLADVVTVALLTGMRPAELFHTRCRSIDLNRRVLTVEEQVCPDCPEGRWIPKVGEWRQLEIAPALLPVLRRMMQGKRPEDLLVENKHGAPYSRLRGSGGSFVRALRQSGLDRKGLSFYSLRHTFAADLASAGVPLEKIGKLMGHTDPRTTAGYAHLRPEALTGVVERLSVPQPWAPLGVTSKAPTAPALGLVPKDDDDAAESAQTASAS